LKLPLRRSASRNEVSGRYWAFVLPAHVPRRRPQILWKRQPFGKPCMLRSRYRRIHSRSCPKKLRACPGSVREQTDRQTSLRLSPSKRPSRGIPDTDHEVGHPLRLFEVRYGCGPNLGQFCACLHPILPTPIKLSVATRPFMKPFAATAAATAGGVRGFRKSRGPRLLFGNMSGP